jgi:hypothetical protein
VNKSQQTTEASKQSKQDQARIANMQTKATGKAKTKQQSNKAEKQQLNGSISKNFQWQFKRLYNLEPYH